MSHGATLPTELSINFNRLSVMRVLVFEFSFRFNKLFFSDVTGIKDGTAAKLAIGAAFSITCKFEATDATKVTWYKSGTKLKEETPSGGVSELSYTIASVAGSDSGVYSCKVEYTGIENPFTGRQDKILEVRGKTEDATTHASVGTPSVTLTCDFYGDAMQVSGEIGAQWFKAGSGSAMVNTEGKYLVNSGTYNSDTKMLTTSLKISQIEAADGAAYTCKTKYTSDNADAESVQTLAILALRKLYLSSS